MTLNQKAVEILQKTGDGDGLDPFHLQLLELAVNGYLNEAGVQAFEELYQQVAAGSYQKPWYHGVENLTLDQAGFVYWRQTQVEHYSFSEGNYSGAAGKAAQELGRRCRWLEDHGHEVSSSTVVFQWWELSGEPDPYAGQAA